LIKIALSQAGFHPEFTDSEDRDSDSIATTISVNSQQVHSLQGYKLSISPDGIDLLGHDEAGVFYGAMTLLQITRQFGKTIGIPCMVIEDWPDFLNRGVMLDISRDRVPTMGTLYTLIDLLSELKVNQLQLYTEHTYAYRNHSEVWADASPMTSDQIVNLDAYCQERFIELVPNQNSFGHMERWLKKPGYQDLAEHPGSPKPRALNPLDPRSISLIEEMYEELLPNFTSAQFNVGCDEVPLGNGHTKDAVHKYGVGSVYLNFLLKIHELVRSHRRVMQFWGDIILRYPELIPELPENIVALEWGYEADHPFDANAQKYAETGVPFYVCPGTSSWGSLGGRTDNAKANIWSAVESGLEHGAIGFLNTDWGDNGHWQQWPIAYVGYSYGAAVSWCADANKEVDLPKLLDLHVFQDSAGMMGRAAYDIGNVYQYPGVIPHNGSVLHHLLLRNPDSEQHISKLTVDALERTENFVESSLDNLNRARVSGTEGQRVVTEIRHVAKLLRYACHAGIAGRRAVGMEPLSGPDKILPAYHDHNTLPPHVTAEIQQISVLTRRVLGTELEKLVEEYRELWQMRSRPGGLEDSVRRWEQIRAAYHHD